MMVKEKRKKKVVKKKVKPKKKELTLEQINKQLEESLNSSPIELDELFSNLAKNSDKSKTLIKKQFDTILKKNKSEEEINKINEEQSQNYKSKLEILNGITDKEVFDKLVFEISEDFNLDKKEIIKDAMALVEKKPTKKKTSKQQAEELSDKINEEAMKIFTRKGQAEKFNKIQPICYDKSKSWRVWNHQLTKWELVDEVDILNHIQRITGADIVSTKSRCEILNSLKQVGRLKEPKPIKPTWVQYKNKIYDVETGENFEATPKYFVTNPIPWEVGESEDTPTIDKLLVEWVGEKYKDNLYEFIAYNTCQDKFMQRIFGFCGGGSNGKGTFIKLNYKFLGEDNCVSSELKSLSEDKFETAVIYKKLLCVMGEVSSSDLKNTNQIKKLAGEDKISFQYKGKTPFTENNTATAVCLTNSLPRTPDKSLGFYRKWLIVDFPNQFNQIQKGLIRDIPEIEFNNLAKKCLRILKELYTSRKFSYEGDFEERMKRYEERSNPVMRFLEENYEEIPGKYLPIRDFSNLCNEHLKKNHLRVLSPIHIGKILREEGFSVGQRKINDVTSVVILNITSKKPLEPLEPLEVEIKPHDETNENLDGLSGSNGYAFVNKEKANKNDTLGTFSDKELKEIQEDFL